MDRQHQIPPAPAHKFKWPEANAKLEQPGQTEATRCHSFPYTSDCHSEPRPRKDPAKPALSWRAQGSCPYTSPFCMGFQVSWSLPGLCSASSDGERNSGLLLRGNIPAMTQIRKLVKNQMSTRKALFRDRL